MSETVDENFLHTLKVLLNECDHFACDALAEYIHKPHTFHVGKILNTDNVYQHQQKIRMVLKLIGERIKFCD